MTSPLTKSEWERSHTTPSRARKRLLPESHTRCRSTQTSAFLGLGLRMGFANKKDQLAEVTGSAFEVFGATFKVWGAHSADEANANVQCKTKRVGSPHGGRGGALAWRTRRGVRFADEPNAKCSVRGLTFRAPARRCRLWIPWSNKAPFHDAVGGSLGHTKQHKVLCAL